MAPMAKPIAVTDDTFEEAVLKAELPTVVDFWAVWCGPCKMIAPVLEEIAEEYDGQVSIAKLDVDHNSQSAMQYGVMSIPTLIVFKDGQPAHRFQGATGKAGLLQQLSDFL